jgi:trehalose 6-phosphate synthase/phosphatase
VNGVGAVAGAPRVLIASNRLPVTAEQRAGGVRYRRSDGGVASGLRHVARNWPVRWYGWNGIASTRPESAPLEVPEDPSLVAVALSASDVTGFYRDYCNGLLWPVLHGLTDDLPAGSPAWQSYVDVNERFANVIAGEAAAGDRIWIHDYHLFLVPNLLRGRTSSRGIPIAFFLHTPFPDPEAFAKVPQWRTLMTGVLGADLIGFHTAEYVENFLAAARELGHAVGDSAIMVGDRRLELVVRPMGIDADAFAHLGNDPNILAEVSRLRACHRKILLGVDRLDYTKGIHQRLLAFELLLQTHPQLHGEITLLQIAVPTRSDVAAYQDLKDVVENTVGRINNKFGTSGWTPVEYLYDTVDLNTLASLYRAADVMLVTPSRDGLNLVAKEFVATRVDGDGVLILSKYAGAAAELASALLVDPTRIKELAEAYYRAVTMSLKERRGRMGELLRVIRANCVTEWITQFVGDPPAEAVVVPRTT